MSLVDTVLKPIKGIFFKGVEFLPNILSAILILLIGWLIAKALRIIVTRLLQAVRFEKLSDRMGLQEIMARGDIRYSIIEVIGLIVYWITILLFLDMAADVLRLTVISDFLRQVVAFIPNLTAALILLGLGILLANFVAKLVRATAFNAGVAEASLLGKVAQSLVIIITLGTVLEQLHLATSFVLTAFLIFLASFGLAFGLAGVKRAEVILGRMLDMGQKRESQEEV